MNSHDEPSQGQTGKPYPSASTVSQSVWENTRTFFPLFVEQLDRAAATTAYVVGASDGKFVLPLARRGLHVHAIEHDRLALDGGPVTLLGPRPGVMDGLRRRVHAADLDQHVEIIEADLLDLPTGLPTADAVWTSCSWHYGANHRRPLANFLDAMKGLCRPGGLVGAEYMMPVDPRHVGSEHYPDLGELRHHFTGWKIIWETHTPPFVEAPHDCDRQNRPHMSAASDRTKRSLS
jgi:SAM-dependent methyltransferase